MQRTILAMNFRVAVGAALALLLVGGLYVQSYLMHAAMVPAGDAEALALVGRLQAALAGVESQALQAKHDNDRLEVNIAILAGNTQTPGQIAKAQANVSTVAVVPMEAASGMAPTYAPTSVPTAATSPAPQPIASSSNPEAEPRFRVMHPSGPGCDGPEIHDTELYHRYVQQHHRIRPNPEPNAATRPLL